MRIMRAVSSTAMFLLLSFAFPAYAGQEKPEEKAQPPKQEPQAKPEKQEQTKAPKQEPQAKPEGQEQAKAPKQEPQAKPEKQEQAKAPKQESQAKPEKQEQAKAPKQAPQAKPEKQEQAKAPKQEPQAKPQEQHQVQARNNAPQQPAGSKGPQRTQEAIATQHAQPALRLSARGSGRIPDERFQSNFGRGHQFQMGNPVMVGGYSRFQCGGYWFGYVQPWPVGWYYTDQFYIDYVDGGYYMYDPYYPGARFAITVVI
jgi:hypothetical protein